MNKEVQRLIADLNRNVAKKKNKFGNANNLVNQFAQKTDDGLPF